MFIYPPVKVLPEHHPAHERIFKYSKDISDFCAFQRQTFQMINWPASFCFSVLPKTARRIHKRPSLALWCDEDHLLKIPTCKTSPLRERTPPEGDDNRTWQQEFHATWLWHPLRIYQTSFTVGLTFAVDAGKPVRSQSGNFHIPRLKDS